MLDTDDGRGLEYFDEEITNDARIALTWQSPGGRKRERPKDIYEEKEGREGAETSLVGGVGGICTSGEEESRMEELCKCPVRHLAQKGTMLMMTIEKW